MLIIVLSTHHVLEPMNRLYPTTTTTCLLHGLLSTHHVLEPMNRLFELKGHPTALVLLRHNDDMCVLLVQFTNIRVYIRSLQVITCYVVQSLRGKARYTHIHTPRGYAVSISVYGGVSDLHPNPVLHHFAGLNVLSISQIIEVEHVVQLAVDLLQFILRCS